MRWTCRAFSLSGRASRAHVFWQPISKYWKKCSTHRQACAFFLSCFDERSVRLQTPVFEATTWTCRRSTSGPARGKEELLDVQEHLLVFGLPAVLPLASSGLETRRRTTGASLRRRLKNALAHRPYLGLAPRPKHSHIPPSLSIPPSFQKQYRRSIGCSEHTHTHTAGSPSKDLGKAQRTLGSPRPGVPASLPPSLPSALPSFHTPHCRALGGRACCCMFSCGFA